MALCTLQTVAAVCSFPSIKDAVDTSVEILEAGIPIAKIEFLDALALEVTNRYFELDYPVAPTLFLEFMGSPKSIEEQTNIVSKFTELQE